MVDLLDAWPAGRALREDLLSTDDGSTLDRTEAVLAAGLDESDRALDRCAGVVAALEATPARPVGEIADELGISHGYLDREFTRVVGMPPRALARVLRVRRLLEQIDVQDDVLWTKLAADLGWYDQSHLVRDVTRHTGVPPVGLRPGAAPLPAAGGAGAGIRPGGRRVKSVQDASTSTPPR